MMDFLSSQDKFFFDILSVGTVIGTITNMLPAIAAVFTIVWTGVRIYETDTVQKLMNKTSEKTSED